ncbi:MAG: hypothetical protein ACK5Z2_09215 [Bacteroidota bacterium]|jgi:hypothetical protein
MSSIHHLNAFLSRFTQVVDSTIIQRTELSLDDKILVTDALLEVLQLHLEIPESEVNHKLIGNILTEKIVKPLRNQAQPIYNAGLWLYFERRSQHYLNYLRETTGQHSFGDEDYLSDALYEQFLDQAYNYLHLTQTMLYLNTERHGTTDKMNEENEKSANKDFTLRRQILALYYLDKVYGISNQSDRTHFAHLAELLTGKNYKNIYDYIRNPFPEKTSSRLADDLRYIREYFVKLNSVQIITLIDKDIQLYK